MLETRPKQDYQSPEKGNKSLHVKHKIDTFVFIWQQAASAFKHCMYSHVQGNMRDAVLVHCECKSDVRLSAEEGMCGWQSLPAQTYWEKCKRDRVKRVGGREGCRHTWVRGWFKKKRKKLCVRGGGRGGAKCSCRSRRDSARAGLYGTKTGRQLNRGKKGEAEKRRKCIWGSGNKR